MDTDIDFPLPRLEDAEDTEKRLAFLAKAGLILSTSRDYEATLKIVSHLAVPFFADYCTIDLFGEDDLLHRLVITHVNPGKASLVEELWQRSAPTTAQAAEEAAKTLNGSYKALYEGRTILVENITDDFVRPALSTETHWQIYRKLALCSYIAVPLITNGKPLGVLTFVTTEESGRSFRQTDTALAEQLSDLAASAVDNSQRFPAESPENSPELSTLQETLLAAVPTGFAFLNNKLRFVSVSETFAVRNNLPTEAYKHRLASETLSPDVWIQAEPFYRRALSGETILNQEISISSQPLASAAQHKVSSLYPVRGDQGEILGIGVVLLDVAERRQAEIDHVSSEARYRSLISATTQLIWVTDAEGNMTDWHDWHMYTGQPVERIAGSSSSIWLLEAIHPDDCAEVAQICTSALAAGKVCEAECRIRRYDSDYLYFSLRSVPVRDEETGRITEWVGAGTNITQRKEAEAARDAALARQGRIARTLQRALLVKPPGDAFVGLEFETLYQPAYDEMLVGGDFYDAFLLDKDRVAFVVGDVSGKGLEAAAHTAELKFTLRALLRDSEDPGQAVARLNAYLRETSRYEGHSLPGHLVALTVVVLSHTSDEAHFVVAGMEPPLILRSTPEATTMIAETIPADGLPLGVLPEWDLEHKAVRTSFGTNDILLLSTDGLTEARHEDESDEFFGLQGVIDAALNTVAQRTAQGSLTEMGTDIIRSAQEFAGGRLHDDVCLLLARCRP